MPRALNPNERAEIRSRLLSEGKKCFIQYGLRKTTLQDLIQAVGIGKGSFYLFFESKEDLFMTIEEAEERRIKAALFDALKAAAGDARRLLKTYFSFQFDVLIDHPFLNMLSDPQTMAQLRLKLPAERFEAHAAEDLRDLTLIYTYLEAEGVYLKIPPPTLIGLSSAIFCLSQGRALIGASVFDSIRNLIIDGLVHQLLENATHD